MTDEVVTSLGTTSRPHRHASGVRFASYGRCQRPALWLPPGNRDGLADEIGHFLRVREHDQVR
jgi:hypothetical protein